MNATKLERSTALDFLASIEDAARVVTEGTALFTPEHLAGQYAFDAACEAGYGCSKENLIGQLEVLADAGAVFDEAKALEFAQQFAAADDRTAE